MGCALGAAFCAGARGAGRECGRGGRGGLVRGPPCWRRDRMCSLPPPPAALPPSACPLAFACRSPPSSASSGASGGPASLLAGCSSPRPRSVPPPARALREGSEFDQRVCVRTRSAQKPSGHPCSSEALTSSSPPCGIRSPGGAGGSQCPLCSALVAMSRAQGPPDACLTLQDWARLAPMSSPQAPRAAAEGTAWALQGPGAGPGSGGAPGPSGEEAPLLCPRHHRSQG